MAERPWFWQRVLRMLSESPYLLLNGEMKTFPVPVDIGDRVRLKKSHPCGENDWEVTKLGMDIGLSCRGCGRKVRLLRAEFDRRFRSYVHRAGGDDNQEQQ